MEVSLSVSLHGVAGAPGTHLSQHLLPALPSAGTGGLIPLLHSLVLGAPVLEPDLNHAHVQSGLGRDLLPGVTRGLGGYDVVLTQDLQLLGRDGGAGSLLIAICKGACMWG